MATLQFCSELDKVWPEMHACWPWQNAIDEQRSLFYIYRYVEHQWFSNLFRCDAVGKFCWTCDAPKGVTRLDGARGKKQVWRPHVRTWIYLWRLIRYRYLVLITAMEENPASHIYDREKGITTGSASLPNWVFVIKRNQKFVEFPDIIFLFRKSSQIRSIQSVSC